MGEIGSTGETCNLDSPYNVHSFHNYMHYMYVYALSQHLLDRNIFYSSKQQDQAGQEFISILCDPLT